MTDNQIINALECCVKTEFISDCAKCEMFAFDCKDTLIEEALDLINRQKAEIETMQNAARAYETAYHRIKSEAIQEFAERLKTRIRKDIDEQGMLPLPYTKKAYDTVMVFVDNLVKEMKEVNENGRA